MRKKILKKNKTHFLTLIALKKGKTTIIVASENRMRSRV
jgi:hypothetical protein